MPHTGSSGGPKRRRVTRPCTTVRRTSPGRSPACLRPPGGPPAASRPDRGGFRHPEHQARAVLGAASGCSSCATPSAQASIFGQSRKSPAGSAPPNGSHARQDRPQALHEPDWLRARAGDAVEDVLIARMKCIGDRDELSRNGRLEHVPPLRIDRRGANRAAAEEPDRTARQERAMSLREPCRLLSQAAHIGRAADDESVVPVDGSRLFGRLQRDIELSLLEGLRDPLGDLPRDVRARAIRFTGNGSIGPIAAPDFDPSSAVEVSGCACDRYAPDGRRARTRCARGR